MAIRKGHFFRSLRSKLVLLFLISIIPLIALLIYNNFYAVKVVQNQVAQSYKNLVNLYMQLIDQDLTEVDKYLYNTISEETDLYALELPGTRENTTYQAAKIRLFNKISNDIVNFKTIDLLFIYSINNQDLISAYSPTHTYAEQEVIQDQILSFLKGQQDFNPFLYNQWYTVRVNDSYSLFHLSKIGNIIVGAWVSTNRLLSPMNLVDFGDKGRALLITGDFEPMNDAEFVKANRIDLVYDRQDYSLSGQHESYLVVGEQSHEGKFSLIALIPEKKILEHLPYLQQINSFISLGSLLIVILVFVFLRKIILLPVKRLVTAMRRIKDSEMSVRIERYPTSYEFELVNETFNNMVSQIQELKISIYEERLNNQKAELQHLKLQINPHFFLNSLNIIYYLARAKDFELIKEMSLCLIQYFRFMFRSTMDYVLLEDEIKHTSNYLRIQQLRFSANLAYSITVDDMLLKYEVPPLVIQIFVENAIKYAMNLDETCLIRISVTQESDPEPYLNMVIQDSGGGFPDEILQQLRMNQELANEEGEHIGIWNVKRRLSLLYQERAGIVFANGPERGAVVQIRIPLPPEI